MGVCGALSVSLSHEWSLEEEEDDDDEGDAAWPGIIMRPAALAADDDEAEASEPLLPILELKELVGDSSEPSSIPLDCRVLLPPGDG